MSRASTRSARLEARVSEDALAMLKRAAEIQGRSLSDFVVTAAHEAAQKTIEETQIIRLSVDDQRVLVQALAAAPEPNAALRKARDAHRRLIRPSR